MTAAIQITLGDLAKQIAAGEVDIQVPLERPRSNAMYRRQVADSYTTDKAFAALWQMSVDLKITPRSAATGEPLKTIPNSLKILSDEALSEFKSSMLTSKDRDIAVRCLRVAVDWDALRLAEENARREAGRYTIEEAAKELADKTGRDVERWRTTLVAEIRAGNLPLRNPRDIDDRLPYAVPNEIDFELMVEQTATRDLNTLLENNPNWGIAYRFATADAPLKEKKFRGIGQQMVSEFLRVIAEMDKHLDPYALPPEMRGGGDSGLRSMVAEALGISPSDTRFKSFARHWERAFKSGELAWADKAK